MAWLVKRRRFGYVRKLPSGHYQASFLDPSGRRRFAPRTFGSMAQAKDWLTVQEATLVQGKWKDPDLGKVPFGGYADRWIDERSGLRPRTISLLTLLSDGEQLTGGYALGPEAGEWLTLAIRARVPLEVLRDVIQPFPTFSEIYVSALKALRREITPQRTEAESA